MLGVVLWSDAGDNKAVIWCEDHGDLAYFNGGVDDPASLMDFDAGDLVHFDLREERHQRYARNPRRVGQGAYAGLPERLCDAAAAPSARHDAVVPSAQVIPFTPPRARKKIAALELA